MKKLALLFAVAFGFSHCAETPKVAPLQLAPAPQVLRGLFSFQKRVATLRECETGSVFQISDATNSLDTLYQKACEPCTFPGESVYAVLRGTIAAKPGDTATQVLSVTQVDALESKNAWNVCVPFEFWCSGTEPFWDLQISKAEDGIFYQNASDMSGVRYPWVAPTIEGDTWTYETSLAPDGKGKMTIVIKKEKCSDGMSDIEYNYCVEGATANGDLRHGAAVRWGEPKLEPK